MTMMTTMTMVTIRTRTIRSNWTIAVGALVVCALGVAPARAQLNTQHVKGLVGLKAGTQAPPGLYFIAPLLYDYSTDEVKDASGNRLPGNVNLDSVAYGGGFSLVTTKKIFGGTYGFEFLFPLGLNNAIQGATLDSNPRAGITDSAVVPVSLGWRHARADVLASYTIYMPTGRYVSGANDNTGFGMWGHELALGTTVYLTKSREYHASTMASIDFQSKKADSNTRVGDAMNLEGGVGGDFLKGGLTAGLDYYTTIKLTDDQIDGFPDVLAVGKNRVFALGPEASLALAHNGVLYGFLKVDYQWEVYARTATQGSEFTVMATFLMKPLKVSK